MSPQPGPRVGLSASVALRAAVAGNRYELFILVAGETIAPLKYHIFLYEWVYYFGLNAPAFRFEDSGSTTHRKLRASSHKKAWALS